MTATRILIVEDELIVALDMQRTLERLGYGVVGIVSTGAAAITETTEAKPDLVLMDIKLDGDIDGIQAATQIREFSDVPIIYITAYADDHTLARAKMTAPFGYLLKVFEDRELQVSIEMALARYDVERKLREHEQWLAITLGSISDAVIATNAQGQVRFMNGTAQELTGWGQSEALERDWKEVFRIIDEETRVSKEDLVEKVFREGSMIRLGNRILLLTKDEQALPIEDSAAPITDRQGQINGIVLVFRSLTERRQAEAALAAERNLLRTLIDSLPDYIYVKDTSSQFMIGNNALAQIMGVATPDELVGKTDFDFYPPELAERFYADEREIIRSGQALIDREEPITNQTTGHKRWLLTTKVPVRDNEGQLVALVGMGRDITERRRLEEQYRQSQKMEAIGQLAGGIAHDFNNLLTVINGYSELMLHLYHSSTSEMSQHYLVEIKKAGERAASLTKQLLAFSRKQILQPEILNLNRVVVDMGKMLQRLIGENIELTIRPAPDLALIRADPHQLEQVLVNLAINARDAMPIAGKLTIETANVTLNWAYAQQHEEVTPGEYVMLTVSDTGVGMTEVVKAHIFEPFFTTKEQGKGTGLGLATCFGIVKQSGGHIEVDSVLGRGTTFKVYLPHLEEKTDLSTKPAAADKMLQGTETILLVEDEEAVRTLAVSVLQGQGYTVLESTNGEEALRLSELERETEIHLLLTDVVMPQMGGRELADRLRAMRPTMKVLFISGYPDDAISHHGILESGIAFMEKPFTLASLTRKVRAVLDR
jgi:two-component system cell cycle sensor histidine kinase/response regulator CckA